MSNFIVVNTEIITPTVLQLSLQPESGRVFDYHPGQYATISFKRGGRPTPVRCFSILSSPIKSDVIQFGIRIIGDFTQSATELEIGDEVNVTGPYGEFVIDEELDKNIVFLAGGIGITPLMSMIRFASDTKLKIPITLLYSCQTQDDVPFYEELIQHEKRNPYLKIGFFITEGSIDKLENGRIYKGRINEDVLDQVTNKLYNSFTYFICGPTRFMSALHKILVNNDVSSNHLITETFGQGVVTEKSHKKSYAETKFVYSMTGALLLFGTLFITGIDLVRAVPKINKIENPQSTITTVSNTPTSTSNSSASNSTANSSNNASSSTNSSQSSTPVQTKTTNNSPVTSVS